MFFGMLPRIKKETLGMDNGEGGWSFRAKLGTRKNYHGFEPIKNRYLSLLICELPWSSQRPSEASEFPHPCLVLKNLSLCSLEEMAYG